MNKSGAILILVLGLLVLSGFAIAADNTTANTSSSINATANTTAITTSSTVNMTKIDKGFACLADKVKSDCTGAQTVQEIALTIMASPTTVTQKCYDRLLKNFKRPENCFGTSSCNVRDTALAILAINHVGQDTKSYQAWLLSQAKNADDLIWYLEQDSNTKSTCTASYNSADYKFNVLDNKKIDNSAGSCLTPAQSDYWLQISPNCYNTTFTLLCDADFIATLLYKQPTSPTIYVLSGTKSAQANTPVDLSIKALCFGNSGCDYESTAWSAVALDATGNNIDSYVPYLIADEESNQKYLPDAFLQILKDFSEYGAKLIQQQQLGIWDIAGSPYGKYYDTSLALIALASSNQQQVTNSKNWLQNSAPGQDGCWNNGNIRDTAIALWALAGRTASVSGATTISECTDFGFFCIPSAVCPGEELLPNYHCSALGSKCCKSAHLQSCSDLSGIICAFGKQCNGVEKKSSDSDSCCVGTCEDIPTGNECESLENSCRSTCSSAQIKTDSSCGTDSALVCCKANPAPVSSGSSWWIWLLVILIILVVLGIIFREKLKIWIYKIKSKFGEDKSKPSSSGGMPPGFGPYSSDKPVQQQRPQMRPMPMPPQRPMQPQMQNRPPMRR